VKLTVVLITIFTYPVFANSTCKQGDTTFCNVQYLRNYDGDTITFNIPNVHPLLGKEIAIRVNGIDTPEKRTKDRCEKDLAIQAQKLIETTLKKAKQIDLINTSRGKYFRIVADVIVDGVSIKDLLIKNNLAYTYDGGTKSKIDWCNVKQLRKPAGNQ